VGGGYIQFALTITGSIYDKPVVYKAGIEDAFIIPSVPGNGSSSFYVSTISGTSSGKSANLLCWCRE
jgi:hypothetical protein